jgi:hypothetical protein
MKTEVKSQKSETKSRRIFLFCLLSSVFCLLSCSIPNLESAECTKARDSVREFYSFHLGNDMKPSTENLKLREKFLSKELIKTLSASTETAKDYFTQTDDYPKAFRIGGCQLASPEKTIFDVLLFWKTDTRSEQRTIKVEAVKENDRWLVDKVENK